MLSGIFIYLDPMSQLSELPCFDCLVHNYHYQNVILPCASLLFTRANTIIHLSLILFDQETGLALGLSFSFSQPPF